MEVQPQLVLLQKTLLNIEGLGRQLYPDLDLWQTAKPFLEEWVRDRVGVKATLKELHKQAPRWGEIFPALPAVVYEVLRKANEGKLRVSSNSDELVRLRLEIRRANQRSVMATVGAAFLISSAVLLGLDGYVPTMLSTIFGDAPLMSWVLGLLGLYLVWAGWPGRDH